MPLEAPPPEVQRPFHMVLLPLKRRFGGPRPQPQRVAPSANVAPDPRIYAVISVQRHFDEPRFTEEEVRLVAALGRHVEQSLRLSMRMIDAELTRDRLIDALSAMSTGVFGLDSLGRITIVDEAGRALIDRGPAIVDRRLIPQYRTNRDDFASALALALGDMGATCPKSVIVGNREDGGPPLVRYFLPVAGADVFTDGMLAKTRVLVLAVEVGHNDPIDPTILRDLMGLTLNEARVAALVGSGLPPRTVAGRRSPRPEGQPQERTPDWIKLGGNVRGSSALPLDRDL